MLMSVIEGARLASGYPELAGKRVLITGLTSSCGVDIAQAFAGHKARLVLQFAEDSEAMQAVAEIVAPNALDVRAFGPVDGVHEGAVQFARSAAQAFGGLDAVINLVPLAMGRLGPSATMSDVEQVVVERLSLPYLVSRIAANRMALSWTEGLVLNIATLTGVLAGPARAFAAVVKTALATMTRSQSEQWAGKAIRFNAIAPQATLAPSEPGLHGEADIAALSLYLASERGKSLSGHVFAAEIAH